MEASSNNLSIESNDVEQMNIIALMLKLLEMVSLKHGTLTPVTKDALNTLVNWW